MFPLGLDLRNISCESWPDGLCLGGGSVTMEFGFRAGRDLETSGPSRCLRGFLPGNRSAAGAISGSSQGTTSSPSYTDPPTCERVWKDLILLKRRSSRGSFGSSLDSIHSGLTCGLLGLRSDLLTRCITTSTRREAKRRVRSTLQSRNEFVGGGSAERGSSTSIITSSVSDSIGFMSS